MRALTLAVLLLAAPPAGAARRRAAAEDEPPKMETWSSMTMEAKAVKGELQYQHGDLQAAGQTFRDSLNSSVQLMTPQGHVVGLDLYRTAELAARRGDFGSARQNLEMLLSRYPDSDYAGRGRDLLDTLPRPKGEAGGAPTATVLSADRPEFALARIQAAASGRADAEALELCRDFLARYSFRPEAEEVRLLGAALYLRLGEPAGAERALTFLVERGRDSEVRAKALHLLAAVELSQGRDQDVLTLVPDVDVRRSFSLWVSRAQLWRAQAEARLGRRDAALARLRALSASSLDSPVRAYALASLASELDRRGDEQGRDEALGRAAEQASRSGMEDLAAAARLSLAHSLYKRGKLDEAARAYGAFAAAHPSHPQRSLAHYQRGLALKRLGRREEAVAAFSEIADKAPESVYAYDATVQLGQLYTDLGSPERAIVQYEKLGRSGDRRGRRESLLLIAQVHYNAKRFKQAIPLYRQFLEENPTEPRRAEIEQLLLTSYWVGDRENPDMLQAFEKYPKHAVAAHARWELGAQAYRSGDYAKAAGWLARYAADYPDAPHAAESLFFLGEARMRQGDAKGAAEAYRARLTRYPKGGDEAETQGRLGAALFAAGDFAGSARAYERAAAGPGAADALWNRALALTKAARPEESLSAYEAWALRFPKDARASSAWIAVAEGREAAGRLDAAAEAFLRVSDESRRAQALLAAGRLRERLTQPARAIAAYEALRATKPAADASRLRGLVRLGLLYEVSDKPLPAMKVYAELLRTAPRAGADWKAAARRMEALTSDGSLVAGRRVPAAPRRRPSAR